MECRMAGISGGVGGRITSPPTSPSSPPRRRRVIGSDPKMHTAVDGGDDCTRATPRMDGGVRHPRCHVMGGGHIMAALLLVMIRAAVVIAAAAAPASVDLVLSSVDSHRRNCGGGFRRFRFGTMGGNSIPRRLITPIVDSIDGDCMQSARGIPRGGGGGEDDYSDDSSPPDLDGEGSYDDEDRLVGAEYDDEAETDEESDAALLASKVTPKKPLAKTTLLGVATKTVRVLGVASLELMKALYRGIDAGLNPPPDEVGGEDDVDGDDEGVEDEADSSLVVTVARTVQRMWNAMVNPPDDVERGAAAGTGVGVASSSVKGAKKMERDGATATAKAASEDFGVYLNEAYHCGYDVATATTPVLGGSLGDALRECRSRARLLVAFVPSSPPPKKRPKKPSFDTICATSLLSPDVDDAAEWKKGSYVVWSARAGSAEANSALKRLRAVSPKKKNVPVLLAAFPAQVMDRTGRTKLIPKLLAQHHCNPPPSSESMAAWLRALRKRHAKQVSAMRRERKELELLRERREGYVTSVAGDAEREREEARAEAERLAREAEERERLEGLRLRRKELLESLPEEPPPGGTGVVTVALRFPDGQSGRRRFEEGADLKYVFNWVDGEFGLVRERVTLSMMNGSKSFTFEEFQDVSLTDAGLSRMCGLRVIPMKDEDKEGEENEEESVDGDV